MLRRLQNPADESGQTFVEWLGAMAFVVVLVTLLVAAAPGIGDKIVHVIQSALDAVTP
jgi:energy-converting hydrogenase Eha subunit E